jgi:hypothetical protein
MTFTQTNLLLLALHYGVEVSPNALKLLILSLTPRQTKHLIQYFIFQIMNFMSAQIAYLKLELTY